jgi:hypothetical protein
VISALSSRLIPLVLAVGVASESEDIQEQILSVVREVRTEVELRGIAQVVALDLAEDQSVPVDAFQDYLREKMIAHEKDPSIDVWETPYGLVDIDGSWIVYSCGPDKEAGTDDDIDRKVDLSF